MQGHRKEAQAVGQVDKCTTDVRAGAIAWCIHPVALLYLGPWTAGRC